MKKIAVIGTGYVGLVTGACLAELGNTTICIDTDADKIEALQSGIVPFFEPGLQELVARNQRSDRISFTVDAAEAISKSEIIFIAVGTPMGEDGHADLQYVRSAARTIATSLNTGSRAIVVNKSTVPVETGDLVSAIIRESLTDGCSVSVVSNPEFLREGNAIADFMSPDRIVLGVYDDESAAVMRELYAPLVAPIIVTDVRTAEMIKYTANAFLATKISFINEIARVCEKVGADVKDVVLGAGTDKRIGTAFMNPGLGFGGSCFPKDVTALASIAQKYGVTPTVLEAVLQVNLEQVQLCAERLEGALETLEGRRIALLGLAFKPNTDDVRESPAIKLVQALLDRGAQVHAHDPEAIATARQMLGDSITYHSNVYESLKDADAMVVATDWNEYKQLDLDLAARVLRGNVLFDTRNIYDPRVVLEQGFHYLSVGRVAYGATAPVGQLVYEIKK
ncbi:MAG TPA: UDP-glucose/GDP-mannose dehydrogenase family protein [Candidatus Baltobacteraceae bacterium]|nr:UDP-glucose/GDP-mannose dehydrogenase family protein [Candidatus Baltobacteraceae bacterium]